MSRLLNNELNILKDGQRVCKHYKNINHYTNKASYLSHTSICVKTLVT